METLIVGIILAGLTGITIVGYRHPAAYRKLFRPLFMLVCGIFVALNIWNAGVSITHSTVSQYIDLAHREAARRAIAGLQVAPSWVWIGFLGVTGYLLFLSLLPQLLSGVDNHREEPQR